MAKYVVTVVVAALALTWLLAGAAVKHPRADFVFVNRGTIATLDPAAMSWMQDIRLALTVWEGLYSYHPVTTEPIPATSLPAEISPDGQTYTFRIRPDARWSNGDPVTAHDFAYAWRRAVEPGTSADYAFFFNLIEGVQAYVAWRYENVERISHLPANQRTAERDMHLREADVRWQKVGIDAIDAKTLRVTLERPVAYFLDLCAFSIFLPVHRQSVERFKVIGDTGLIYYDEQWTKPYNTHFNGPFVMTEWLFRRSIKLERNPHYWDHQAVKLSTIQMLDVEDANTAWLMYSAGAVDWLSSLDMDYAPELIRRSASPLPGALNDPNSRRGNTPTRRDIHAFPAFGTYFYNFNCEPKLPDGTDNPWHDRRVRQAFALAVDKQQLVDRVIRRGNLPADTFIPPRSIPNYPTVAGLGFDPARARELLAEAGFTDMSNFPVVEVLFNTGFNHGQIAEAICKMWETNLGVRTAIRGIEVKLFREDKKNARYVVCRASWYGDYGDPTTFLEMFQSENGNNDSHFRDRTYDDMLEEAERQPTPEKRLAKLAEAERYLVNEALPLLPLYYYVNIFALDPDRVANLHLTPRMMTMLKYVEVSP